MAEKKESIEISYKANINDLKKKLETLPDITSQEAKKMVSALDRQLKQAERAAKRSAEASRKAARASSKAAKQASVDFDKLASSAGMVAGAFGAMGAGIVMFSQEVADLTNELTDASAKSGIAIETLAGLRLAAEGSGIEFSNLEGGLIKFQTSIVEAGKGSKALAESFSSIGVEVKNVDGSLRDSNDVFNDTIKALGEIESTTERNAMAMKLFGKTAGAGLIQSGALENLENMKTLATEFGVAVDEDAVRAMGHFQRKIAEFDTVAQGTFQRLLESVGGRNSVANGIDAATQAMVFFGSVASDTLGFAGQSFENLFGSIQAVALALSGDFATAKQLIADLGEETNEAAENFFNMFDRASAEVERFNEVSAESLKTEQKREETARQLALEAEKEAKAKENQAKWEKKIAELQKKQAKDLARFHQMQQEIANMEEELSDAFIQNVLSEEEQLQAKHDSDVARVLELGDKTGDMYKAKQVAAALDQKLEEDLQALREKGIEKQKEAIEATTGEMLGAFGQSFAIAGDMITEFAGQNKAAQERAFAINKAISVASITMKTAEAIIAAQSQPPPLNVISAVNAAAVGAAQLAKVQSAQPSFHMGGMAPDETNARLQRGEGILSAQAVRRIGGEKGLDRIERGEGMEKETVVIIQPFKHFGRFTKELGYKKPKQTGVGAY